METCSLHRFGRCGGGVLDTCMAKTSAQVNVGMSDMHKDRVANFALKQLHRVPQCYRDNRLPP